MIRGTDRADDASYDAIRTAFCVGPPGLGFRLSERLRSCVACPLPPVPSGQEAAEYPDLNGDGRRDVSWRFRPSFRSSGRARRSVRQRRGRCGRRVSSGADSSPPAPRTADDGIPDFHPDARSGERPDVFLPAEEVVESSVGGDCLSTFWTIVFALIRPVDVFLGLRGALRGIGPAGEPVVIVRRAGRLPQRSIRRHSVEKSR